MKDHCKLTRDNTRLHENTIKAEQYLTVGCDNSPIV